MVARNNQHIWRREGFSVSVEDPRERGGLVCQFGLVVGQIQSTPNGMRKWIRFNSLIN